LLLNTISNKDFSYKGFQIKLLLFSLLLYSQNYLFLLFFGSGFGFSLLEFLMLYALISLFSKSRYFKAYLLVLQGLYLIHFTFIVYFGTHVHSSDIYLFFTHITETFETLGTLYEVGFYPFVVGMTSLLSCL
jgi:hypothetical protein